MTGVIIQARMSSSRLPGKALMLLSGEAVLYHVVERTRRARCADIIIVATTEEPEDDKVAAFCAKRGYVCFRGPRDNVLERYFEAARTWRLDTVVRVTSDCPLIDPAIIDLCVERFQTSECDYMSNTAPGERSFPRGLDVEVFTFVALERADREAREPYEREHVTPYIHENKKGEFRVGPMLVARGIYARPQYRLTLDYPEDYKLLKLLYGNFYRRGGIVAVSEVLAYLDEHPKVVALNASREEGYPRAGIRK